MAIIDKVRQLWQGEQQYEVLDDSLTDGNDHAPSPSQKRGFSWIEYSCFLLLGISMLWAWNMFLAAGPYFQRRFWGHQWVFENFQAAEISVSAVTNLGSMLILTRLQTNASYPKRIISSLIINMVTFAFLALFTEAFLGISPKGYFAFLMITVFASSLATGLCQNGIFAYVSGFGEPRYTQGIMTGQAIAGVLPCIAQIVSVLSVQSQFHNPPPDSPSGGKVPPPTGPPPVHPSSAFAYFLTATAISVATLLSFVFLLSRNRQPKKLQNNALSESIEDLEADRIDVPMIVLARKLRWLAMGVFLTFAITMVFPDLTQRIVSVRPYDKQPPLLQPQCFIPLAFLFWNVGDLLGRLITAVPSLTLVHRPKVVFTLAVSRIGFIGLYHLCNIRGKGAVIESDFFYLVVVQLLFGITNGYLGSTCMIGASEWVEPKEREAAGGFMGLCLVAGLTVGSLASFFLSV